MSFLNLTFISGLFCLLSKNPKNALYFYRFMTFVFVGFSLNTPYIFFCSIFFAISWFIEEDDPNRFSLLLFLEFISLHHPSPTFFSLFFLGLFFLSFDFRFIPLVSLSIFPSAYVGLILSLGIILCLLNEKKDLNLIGLSIFPILLQKMIPFSHCAILGSICFLIPLFQKKKRPDQPQTFSIRGFNHFELTLPCMIIGQHFLIMNEEAGLLALLAMIPKDPKLLFFYALFRLPISVSTPSIFLLLCFLVCFSYWLNQEHRKSVFIQRD